MRHIVLLAALTACAAAPPPPAPPAPPLTTLPAPGTAWWAAAKQIAVPSADPLGDVIFRDDAAVAFDVGHALRIVDAPPAGAPQLEVDLVTVGFVDAHAHPVGLGRLLVEVDLIGAATYAEALRRVQEAAEGDGWLLGRGWDQNDWPDAPPGGWPLASDLDRVVPDRPVALRRVDGHATWANSSALAASGIDRRTRDPAGGRVIRDAAGAPAGVLVDTAAKLLDVPDPTDEAVEGWLRAAQDAMLAAGLVGVHDMGVDDQTLRAYERLEADGALRIRVQAYLMSDSDAAARLLDDGPHRGDRLSVIGIKAYADGALGSRGAHLSREYADAPGQRGLVITTERELAELATRCLRAGVQLAVHGIGDQAVTDILDAFEAARAAVPERSDVPLRLEHAQVVGPADAARFQALGVVASVQPTHATSDMPWAADRLGHDRIALGYAWQDLRAAGAHLALGSDFPVEDVRPALGLWAAVTRTDAAGAPEGGWQPEQRLALETAITGFTTGAARAAGLEPPRSAVAPLRDATLWRTIAGPPGFEAVATVIDGDVVWAAEGVALRRASEAAVEPGPR